MEEKEQGRKKKKKGENPLKSSMNFVEFC